MLVLLPRLKFFPKLAEFRLQDTNVTDAGLDAIGKAFQESKTLQRIDATGSNVTGDGLRKLKNTLGETDVRQ